MAADAERVYFTSERRRRMGFIAGLIIGTAAGILETIIVSGRLDKMMEKRKRRREGKAACRDGRRTE